MEFLTELEKPILIVMGNKKRPKIENAIPGNENAAGNSHGARFQVIPQSYCDKLWWW